MGILKTIFGSGDVISKGFDLIDDMHTSDTEMIEAKTKQKTDLLNAYAPFKIAQRYLAVMFGLTYIVTYVLVMTMVFMGRDVSDVKDVMAEFQIGWIMLTIIGFYFMGGAAEGVMNKRKS
jgi:predicted metal-dependent phosphotriesterase family hydrolase